ncbi:acetyltransferase [Haladaptatus sp. W1]|uniref:maltose acetyltransferase domain-containing protein n=1 Tax=Haladaptatus sp. W1 TaxID=1897478 RepID=UPI0008498C95|nr:maltose acetyltransferase domain-containing protein [Haladaptatus sp. W1]ODR80778.1 acetyltransferase [Haladaptatus sp. W1]
MVSEKEKMLAGELYDPADPELADERRRARELTRRFNATDETETETREPLVQELFGSTGEQSHVEPPFRCDYGYNIHVGSGFYANFDCVILDVCPVEMGRNCWLGPGVHVYTATHPLDAETRVQGPEYGKPVAMGDDVWVGGRAVITPGVTVGDGAVVAAGAVVTDDVPENTVVGGNPATVVEELDG